MPTFDPGEALRVTRDAKGVLHVHHGAAEIATVTKGLGGAVRVVAGDRTWRLTPTTGKGWTSDGDPPAELQRRRLRPNHLTIGEDRYAIGRRRVRGPDGRDLLKLGRDDSRTSPAVRAEIVTAPPQGDPLAAIALTTAAAVIGVDLRPPLGEDRSGFAMGQRHAASGYWHAGGHVL